MSLRPLSCRNRILGDQKFAPKKSRNILEKKPRRLLKCLAYFERFFTHQRRLAILNIFFLFFAAAISFRLFYLQKTEYQKWSKLAAKQQESSVQVKGARGEIKDSNGNSLATSVKTVSLGIHPQEIKDLDSTAQSLAQVLNLKPQEIKMKIAQNNKKFIWLEKNLPLNTEEEIKDLHIAGLVSVQEFGRYYPRGSLAAPLIGKVGMDGNGLSGIELAFEKELAAPNLSFPVKRDARGNILSVVNISPNYRIRDFFSLSSNFFQTPIANAEKLDEVLIQKRPLELRNEGFDIVLSLDADMQEILEQELQAGLEQAQAKKTFAVVMNAENGEILALAQSPSFDLNQDAQFSPDLLRNSIVQDSFEPGSTIKPLIAAAALEDKIVDVQEEIFCENGSYQVGKFTIKDVHPQGKLNLKDILIRSSNIGMTKIGQRLGKDRLFSLLRNLGYGQKTDLEIAGEENGILRDVKNWSDVDQATHSFGQGISVTAMQMVRAYAVLVNGGFLVRPSLLKNNGVNYDRQKIFSEETVNQIKEALNGVIYDEHGTAKKAAIEGVTVFGKTGTAQKARLGGRGYDADKILASFVGFIDAKNMGIDKKLVMFVGVDEPGVKPRWGGTVAAPIFKNAMERILAKQLTLKLRNNTNL